jgi:hypothetical protein
MRVSVRRMLKPETANLARYNASLFAGFTGKVNSWNLSEARLKNLAIG